MKSLLALVGLAVVGFAGAGWYFGWYKFSEQTDSQGHIQLKVNVDSNKIKADGKKLENVIETVGQKGVNLPTQSQPPVPPPFQTTNYGSAPPAPPPSPPQIQWPDPPDVQVPPIQFPQPPPIQLPGGKGQ